MIKFLLDPVFVFFNFSLCLRFQKLPHIPTGGKSCLGTVMNSFCHLEKSTGAITCCIQPRNCSLHLFIDPDISFSFSSAPIWAGHLRASGCTKRYKDSLCRHKRIFSGTCSCMDTSLFRRMPETRSSPSIAWIFMVLTGS